MSLRARAGNLGLDVADDVDGERVRLFERLGARDFEVEVYELEGAGAARAYVVDAEDTSVAVARDDLRHLLVNFGRELLVHQHVNGFARDGEGCGEDVDRDGDGEERIGDAPVR